MVDERIVMKHEWSGMYVSIRKIKRGRQHIGYFWDEEAAHKSFDLLDDRTSAKAELIETEDVMKDFDKELHAVISIAGIRYYIDRSDLESVLSKEWVVRNCYMQENGWGSKSRMFHRLKTNPPDGMIADHINTLKNDNRSMNLRIVHPSLNNHNRKFDNKTGFRGVKFRARLNKYEAYIEVRYSTMSLGRFDTAEEAAKAFDRKAVDIYGKAAMTNFDISNYAIPEKLEIDSYPTRSFKKNKPNKPCPSCGDMISHYQDLCKKCQMKQRRREIADSEGRVVKDYAPRVTEKSETCLVCGSDKVFCGNLCGICDTRKRKEEGYVKPPKIKYFCLECGVNRRWKHKEGVCKSCWNKKNGIVPKITGRPQKSSNVCSSCGANVKGTVKGLCKQCYIRNYHGRGGVISNDVICKELV